MNIGERIRQIRKMSGMTQEELAEKLNVSRQTVSKWESGTSYPLAFSEDGIFAASGHSVEKYVISEGTLSMAKGVCERFNNAGNETPIPQPLAELRWNLQKANIRKCWNSMPRPGSFISLMVRTAA